MANTMHHAHKQNREANVLGGDQRWQLLHNKHAAQRRCEQAHNAGGQRSRRRREERLPCVELLHRVVQRRGDLAVHIHILQPDQSLPDDSALMGDEHPRSEDGLGEYGVSEKSVADHNSGNHGGKAGARRPKSNTVIQSKAIRSSRPDV